MPQLDSYLFFNGDCAEALRFYERTLGGKIEMMMTYGEGPPEHCPEGAKNRIMHASMSLEGLRLMASDTPTSAMHTPAGGFALSLNYPDAAAAKRVFDLLAQGGKVTMPMGKTFWAEAFGMLSDRFGTPWMVGGGQSS